MNPDPLHDRILNTIRPAILKTVLDTNEECYFTDCSGTAVDTLEDNEVYPTYYDWILQHVPLEVFNLLRAQIFACTWKEGRRPVQYSFFTDEENFLVLYIAFPTICALFSRLGFTTKGTLRRNAMNVAKQNGRVVLGTLVREETDLVHARHLIGQSWDGKSPIFTQSRSEAFHIHNVNYSHWTPSILRSCVDHNTLYTNQLSTPTNKRVGSVDSERFLLETAYIKWVSTEPHVTASTVDGIFEVGIPAILYTNSKDLESMDKV